MSARTLIDALEFVRSGKELRGEIAVASLARLADSLYEKGGRVSYVLAGGTEARGRPRLKLEVGGALHLRCQRCLESLEFPLHIESTLLVLRPGEEDDSALDDPHAPDAIEASPELDVDELVEDEILLALPFAPRHAEGACRRTAQNAGSKAQPASDLAAKLAAWKKN